MPNKIIDVYKHTFGLKGFDYDRINENVFLGTNMCCQFGFSKELLLKGVKADISLESERIDAPRGVDYFLWLPTKDGFAPKKDKLIFGVKTLEFFEERKIKVYIHCKNGHGRAPTLVAAYLIKKGFDVGRAVDFLKNKRPSVHLNDAQIAALEEFKKEIISYGHNIMKPHSMTC